MNPETLKLLEENIGNTPHYISVVKSFPNGTPFAQELKSTIDKWKLMNVKLF